MSPMSWEAELARARSKGDWEGYLGKRKGLSQAAAVDGRVFQHHRSFRSVSTKGLSPDTESPMRFLCSGGAGTLGLEDTGCLA